MNTAHETTSFTVEIRVNLLLKSCLVKVAAADSYTQRNSLLFSLASYVLVDGNRGVNTSTFAEESSHSSTGTFRCNENDIDVFWHIDFGEILEDRRETMGEVESLVELSECGDTASAFVLTLPLVSCGLMRGQVSL